MGELSSPSCTLSDATKTDEVGGGPGAIMSSASKRWDAKAWLADALSPALN